MASIRLVRTPTRSSGAARPASGALPITPADHILRVSTRAEAKVYYVRVVGGRVVENVLEPERIA